MNPVCIFCRRETPYSVTLQGVTVCPECVFALETLTMKSIAEARDKDAYAELYLKSPHWQTVRRLATEHFAGRCAFCPPDAASDKLRVHHLTYERLGCERLADLQLLCDDHHRETHGIAPPPPPPPAPVEAPVVSITSNVRVGVNWPVVGVEDRGVFTIAVVDQRATKKGKPALVFGYLIDEVFGKPAGFAQHQRFSATYTLEDNIPTRLLGELLSAVGVTNEEWDARPRTGNDNDRSTWIYDTWQFFRHRVEGRRIVASITMSEDDFIDLFKFAPAEDEEPMAGFVVER